MEHEENVTLHGLCAWYKNIFEKFGHVVTCKNKNKLGCYRDSMHGWVKAAATTKTEVEERDRRREIDIMERHMTELEKVLNVLHPVESAVGQPSVVPSAQTGGKKSKRKSKKSSKRKSKRHSK